MVALQQRGDFLGRRNGHVDPSAIERRGGGDGREGMAVDLGGPDLLPCRRVEGMHAAGAIADKHGQPSRAAGEGGDGDRRADPAFHLGAPMLAAGAGVQGVDRARAGGEIDAPADHRRLASEAACELEGPLRLEAGDRPGVEGRLGLETGVVQGRAPAVPARARQGGRGVGLADRRRARRRRGGRMGRRLARQIEGDGVQFGIAEAGGHLRHGAVGEGVEHLIGGQPGQGRPGRRTPGADGGVMTRGAVLLVERAAVQQVRGVVARLGPRGHRGARQDRQHHGRQDGVRQTFADEPHDFPRVAAPGPKAKSPPTGDLDAGSTPELDALHYKAYTGAKAGGPRWSKPRA